MLPDEIKDVRAVLLSAQSFAERWWGDVARTASGSLAPQLCRNLTTWLQ